MFGLNTSIVVSIYIFQEYGRVCRIGGQFEWVVAVLHIYEISEQWTALSDPFSHTTRDLVVESIIFVII